MRKYHELYEAVLELVGSLQEIEPGGTLMDDLTITSGDGRSLRIGYTAQPIIVSVEDGKRKVIVRVVEGGEGNTSPPA
jgi:hypothetical protein